MNLLQKHFNPNRRNPSIIDWCALALAALLGFVTLSMMFSAPARAAQGVNAVAAFYEDATYELVGWDDLAILNQRDKRFVALAIYHIQSPGDWPNAVLFTGLAEWIGIKRSVGALTVRRMFDTPKRATERSFYETFEQTLDRDKILEVAVAGVVAEFDVLPFDDRAYAVLQDRANGAYIGLRFEPVPSRGMY